MWLAENRDIDISWYMVVKLGWQITMWHLEFRCQTQGIMVLVVVSNLSSQQFTNGFCDIPVANLLFHWPLHFHSDLCHVSRADNLVFFALTYLILTWVMQLRFVHDKICATSHIYTYNQATLLLWELGVRVVFEWHNGNSWDGGIQDIEVF